ncbi:arylformamidase [Bacillus haikouensis]|jgi:arylformamidase|uniref:arylformamidase n=1 Tax=Bacillus haikouensis TaxID=1510468 RepID=UPI001553ABCA|nr:arylformamidase [Bacillus haikouensis]NQD66545.1 arylformamidase [Bacillus haikouensis]
MKIIDISQPLHNGTPVWPGDTPFSFSLNWTKEDTGSVNVGQLTMSAHTGTHVDAPFHFDNEGNRILDLPLDRYIGPAVVVSVGHSESIGPEHLTGIDLTSVKKVLFKTDAWKDKESFPESIPSIRAELAHFLKEKGIHLVGVDLPSVDPLDSKELDAHHALHKNDILILEGIVLKDAVPGYYELYAMPLPLKEADGSPVRAVLVERE